MNLTWGTGCWQDNPATLQTFACDSNDGSASFTVSFAPDRNLDDFDELYAVLDLQSDSPELPDWWQLTDPGGCRQGALSTSADFTAAPGGCADPWQGQIPGYYTLWRTASFPGLGWPAVTPNRAQFRVLYGTYPAVPLVMGTEYYGFTATITYQETVGAGACAGCSTPVTLVLNAVTLRSRVPNLLTNPLDNMCLRWQAGGATPCDATPARNTTWGQLKSLYR
jgi:hypothetical protein